MHEWIDTPIEKWYRIVNPKYATKGGRMKYQRLKGEMLAKNMTQEQIAKKIGITTQALNAKLNGRSQFTIKEAQAISDILDLADPGSIFFSIDVPNTQR